MIVKIPVYFQIEGLEGAKIDHDYLKEFITRKLEDHLEGESVKIQGGFFSDKKTVKAHFRTSSEVHEILRTKT